MGTAEAEDAVECAIDASDTTDITTLRQRGQQILDASAQGTYDFTATINPGASLIYGRDFELGDKCTVVVRQTSRTLQITDVTWNVGAASEGGDTPFTFAVGVGTPAAAPKSLPQATGKIGIKDAYRQPVGNVAARIANKERNA
jgi:hypothetical protein